MVALLGILPSSLNAFRLRFYQDEKAPTSCVECSEFVPKKHGVFNFRKVFVAGLLASDFSFARTEASRPYRRHIDRRSTWSIQKRLKAVRYAGDFCGH